jgi:FixJ family two-component response regulator
MVQYRRRRRRAIVTLMDTLLPWIAVIDDEEPVRRALLRLLRSAGLAGRAFASGADFLATLNGDWPYCVVLDLHMPGMSGFEVLAQLAAVAPEIGVIVATGQHSAENEARVRRHQPLAYLRKPVNDQQLLDAILAARGGMV